MLKELTCIIEQHDIRFVILSAFVCLVSSLTAFALAKQAEELKGARHLRRILLIGYVTGAGVWATHFIAMLAYEPHMPTVYLYVESSLSFFVSIIVAISGWGLVVSGRKHARALGGAIITFGIAAMHYLGISALQTAGTFQYDVPLAAFSLIASGLFVMLALTWRSVRFPRVPVMPALFLSLGICALHFGSMSAITILPSSNIMAHGGLVPRYLLVLGVMTVVLILLSIAIFVMILDVRIKRTADEVAHAMSHDTLTGLLNISGFDRAAAARLTELADQKFTLLRVDLSNFREINETYGRDTGDHIIAEVAQQIHTYFCNDIVGRWMGDEFHILIAAKSIGNLDSLARKICECFGRPICIGFSGDSVQIGAHVGAARYPEHAENLEGLRTTAGYALYSAKQSGSLALVEYSPSMAQQRAERHPLAQALGEALEKRQFSLAYQPISCVVTGGIVGFEALLRWDHPTRGNVPPIEFIPVAEAAGQMVELGNWVLTEACRQAADWTQPLKIAVNLSAVQFSDPNFVMKVRQALTVSNLAPSRLELEITESILIVDVEKTVQILRELKAIGISISMDDFGTGFSSLSYFSQFPFDKVKIDQSFVKDMATNRQSMAIITAVIGLSRVLGMIVLAEGVETEEQLQILSAEGCHQAQGYLLGRPAPAETVEPLIEPTNTSSHHCITRCDECLERLRPPRQLKKGSSPTLFITRSDRAGIAA